MCFAIRRGEVERLDPKFIIHGGHQRLRGVRLVPLSSLTLREPDYGAPYRAVSREANQHKYIRVTDFDDFGIHENHEFMAAEDFDLRYVLDDGDVLFARSGATAGKTFIYRPNIGPAIFAGYCIRFRFDKSKTLPRFVWLYTKTNRYQAWVRSIQRPSGQPNINKEEFKSFTIPLPELSRQSELVAMFDATRKARAHKHRQADDLLAGLDGFVHDALGLTLPPPEESIIHAARLSDLISGRCDASYHAPRFRRAAEILANSKLRKEPLGKLSPQLSGGATPTRGDQELYSTSGIHFLRIMNVAPFEIRLDDVKYITAFVHENALVRSQLRPNDVLMTITGRVGTAAVVPPEVLPANINQHIVRIRLVSDAILPEFLAAYLNSSLGLMLTNRGVTGGTRMAVDYGTISQLLIPVPHVAVQSKIVTEVARRREQARALRDEARQLWEQAKQDFENALLAPV